MSAVTIAGRRQRRLSRRARRSILVAFPLALALLVRAAYVLGTEGYVPRQDARSYSRLAAGLAGGHGWVMGSSAYRPPGYPLFLAAVYLIVGIPHKSWVAARLVEALIATVSVGLIGLMARQAAGRRPMLISMTVAAIYLPLVLVGVSLMSESWLVPLVLAATNLALKARTASEHRYRWVALAGAFAGLAALTRGNGIVVGPALAFLVWTAKPRFSVRSAGAPALLLAVMVLTIMPWTVRNAIAQHAFIPVTTELGNTLSGTYNDQAARHHYIWGNLDSTNYLAIKRNRRLDEATRDARLTSAVFRYVGQHPEAVPEATFWNTMRLFELQGRFVSRRSAVTDVGASAPVSDLAVYIFWAIGIFALLGVFTRAARAVPRALWLVPLFLWAAEAPITTGTPRFRAVLDPFLILLAAFAIDAALSTARRRLATVETGERAREPAGA